jgi:transposase InsO family protein
MREVGRTLTFADTRGCRFLICDRDAKWSPALQARLADAGQQIVRTSYRAPNANAHAERFVRSFKEECLNRLVPLGDRHFRLVIAEYLEHYHRERNHQGLDNELIAGDANHRSRPSPRATWWASQLLRASRMKGLRLTDGTVRA